MIPIGDDIDGVFFFTLLDTARHIQVIVDKGKHLAILIVVH